MKKIFLTLTAVLLSGFLFTSASPSLDGRAVVADVGVFPRGYFAKTVGYLPGDSIKVTNPVNGERIDILVIGSLDASDGVAILLSPEAAEALSIKKNSNNLVKLTKRNGTADDIVNGSAYITKGDFEGYDAEEFAQAEDEADFTEEFARADDEISDENFSDEIVIIEDENNGEEFAQAENEAEEDFGEEFAQGDDENLSDEVVVIEDEVGEEENFSEEFAQGDDEALEENISDEIVFVEDEIPEDEILEDIHEELVRDEFPEEFENPSAEYEYVEADDIFEDEQKRDFSERVIEEEIPEEYAFESEFEKIEDAEIAEEFEESDFVNAEEFAEAEEELEEEYLFESEDELAKKDSDIEENLIDESVYEDDEYEAIVLVPSDENPPAQREDEDKKESRVSEKVASEETPSPKKETSYTAATELAPRKYYVQIAVYNEAENVEEVNALYGKRYPLVVLENGRRKTVMVGPFNVDEYGIILERFKAYGFKDAFVKNTF